MNRVTLDQAIAITAGAFAKGRDLGLKPLSVVVADPGGHLISFQRQDGASNGRFQIAMGKAAGALSLGVSSRVIAEMAAQRPAFVAGIGTLWPDGVIPAAGGVIIVDEDGAILGAVGVTGDTSDNDELCAFAGIAAAGLGVLK